MEKRWLALLMVLICGACALTSEEPSDELGFPPIELIERNMTETDVTVIVEITHVQHLETTGNYSSWEIGGKIRRSLKGNLPEGGTIHYDRTVEGDSIALPIESLHLVSFIWKKKRLVIPDTGYHFSYSTNLQRQIKAKFP